MATWHCEVLGSHYRFTARLPRYDLRIPGLLRKQRLSTFA